jgi:hypothetical protein
VTTVEERRARLRAVAEAHARWVQAHERVFEPGRSVKGSDYNLHAVDVSALPDVERAFQELVAAVGAKAAPGHHGGFNPQLHPRYPQGAPAHHGGQFAPAPGGGRGGGRPSLGSHGGNDLGLAGRDPSVRAAIAANTPAGQAVPDPAKTRVVAARDNRGRLSGYVVWQSEAGGTHPEGHVHQVWVHRAQRGQGLGDAMVAAAQTADPRVTATPNPHRPGAGGGAVSPPAPPANPRVAAPPAPAVAAPAAPSRAPRAARTPSASVTVPDLSKPGDVGGPSGNFTADAARVDRLQKAYMRGGHDTQSLFSKGGRYTRARQAQQQAVIDHFLNQPGVKADRKILVLGGLPGAGKTTTINSPAGQAALGISLGDYVTVNADEVKDEMVRRGMVPDYPGLTPEESATMYHAESFEIANSLMNQAAQRGLNMAYDTSLKTSSQIGFPQGAARAAGGRWSTQLVFVDVPVGTAKQRAVDRYQQGGRYMPLGLIDGMKSYSPRYQSGPAQEFEAGKRMVGSWVHFDNSGTAPVVKGKG